MKKTVTIALLLAMLVSAASCGGEKTPAGDNTGISANDTSVDETTAEPTEDELHALPEKNMDGFNLRFYNYDDSWLSWAINPLDATEQNADKVNDEIYNRNRRVEAKFNAVITEDKVPHTNDNLEQLVMSGDNAFDIVMIYDENVAGIYSSGILDTWDKLPYVDLERSWWNADANNVFQIQGKQFAAVGDFTLAMLSRGFVMLFNKDMLASQLPDTNLYDLVRDGKWTLDAYAEVGKNFVKDINGDGVYDENDQYATAGAVKLSIGALVTGADVKYISTNSDGDPYFAIPGNTHAFDVFEKIFNIHNGSNIYFAPVKSDVHSGSKEAQAMFKNQQTLFMGTSTKAVANYRDANFDIGIIPFPKYDEAQDGYRILTSGATVAAIPKTLPEERRENVGILLEALCRDSQKNLIPTYREVVLKTKYARDEDSADMLDIIFKSGTYDLGLSVFPGDTYYSYMELYRRMKDNFSSTTDRLAKKVAADIEKLTESLNSAE